MLSSNSWPSVTSSSRSALTRRARRLVLVDAGAAEVAQRLSRRSGASPRRPCSRFERRPAVVDRRGRASARCSPCRRRSRTRSPPFASLRPDGRCAPGRHAPTHRRAAQRRVELVEHCQRIGRRIGRLEPGGARRACSMSARQASRNACGVTTSSFDAPGTSSAADDESGKQSHSHDEIQQRDEQAYSKETSSRTGPSSIITGPELGPSARPSPASPSVPSLRAIL